MTATLTAKRNHHAKQPSVMHAADLQPINPNYFYRKSEGPKFFGLLPAALDDAINEGLIPAPIPVIEGRRACGWYGSTILEHQRKHQEAAAARKTAGRRSK